jgi:hypothetical protein
LKPPGRCWARRFDAADFNFWGCSFDPDDSDLP